MQLRDANIRSSSYLIAETQVKCERCNRPARVLAIGLPPNHESLTDGEWQTVDANAFIFYVGALSDSVSRVLAKHSAEFRRTCGTDPAESHWANHCPSCSWVFSDDALHCEPGGFMPGTTREAQGISLIRVEQPLSAFAAGYALDPEFFASMPRR
jgi:hypothetical protein